jgi:hypothetical protein
MVSILNRESQVFEELSVAFSDYVESIRPSLNGSEWLNILNCARYSGVPKETVDDWEANFDEIVDLSVLCSPKQLVEMMG